MAARLLLLAAMLAAAAAQAEPIEVISPRPDAVSITIYRDFFALITETRTVDLPEGPVTLSFDGVVETLLPASAVVTDTGRSLVESNYDYQQLTPQALFGASVGREVLLTRTHPRSGKVTQVPATVLSAGVSGIVLRTSDGNEALHCSGLPEQVTFETIPEGLLEKPRLSVRLATGPAGRRTVRVSYLAHGFAWQSDYVARLSGNGDRIDLQGWATLRNFTSASFRDAQVQLVAGRLHLLDAEEERGTGLLGNSDDYPFDEALREMREETLEYLVEEQLEMDDDYDDGRPQLFTGCVPWTPVKMRRVLARAAQLARGEEYYGDDIEEVVVTGLRGSLLEREEIADYQLYRLPWPTDLNARQTKQALFLDKRAIEVERFYGVRLDVLGHVNDDEIDSPILVLGFENRRSAGLGEPLPEGTLRMFEPGDSGDLFSGEGTLRDTAVGVPVEVRLAAALDLYFEIQVVEEAKEHPLTHTRTQVADAEIHISNAKHLPVNVEIRQDIHDYNAGARVSRASHRTQRKFGDYAWRVRVPAHSSSTLTYRISRVETGD